MSAELSTAETLKFELLARGVTPTMAAQHYLVANNPTSHLTPADYASTSGLILRLDEDVWVNAPTAEHNPNFVTGASAVLDLDDSGAALLVRHGEVVVPAAFWLPPTMHDECNEHGEPYTSFGFIHTDRLRISPIEGCAFTCKFCDLPYEFRYRKKPIERLLDAMRRAMSDPVQPAHHMLVSGGTPRPDDYGYLRDCYAAMLLEFPDVSIDIMMVPMPEVVDPQELDRLGVDGLSLNIEIVDRNTARSLMRRKHDQGLDTYLEMIGNAADALGPGRVRSMLMVGLEPLGDTLRGVEMIAERGAVPVLSPFRPDPSTPLRDWTPPSATELIEAYLRSLEITRALGVPLGPPCIPCSHNTLTLSVTGAGDAFESHGTPAVI